MSDAEKPTPPEKSTSQFFAAEEFAPWREEWQGMPEYEHEDLTPCNSVIINFAAPEDMRAFAQLIGQTLTPKTQSVWYPKAEIGHMANKRYADD